LHEYGGHAGAAGLAIDGEKIPDFTAQMNRLAGSLLSDEDLLPSIDVAQEINPKTSTTNLWNNWKRLHRSVTLTGNRYSSVAAFRFSV